MNSAKFYLTLALKKELKVVIQPKQAQVNPYQIKQVIEIIVKYGLVGGENE